MEFTFGGPAGMFGFFGEFGVSTGGEISLTNLLLAHSCEHAQEALGPEIEVIEQKIKDSPWEVAGSKEQGLVATWDEVKIELFSEATRDFTVATHLLVSHDDPAIFRKPYFEDYFELRSQQTQRESSQKNPSGYHSVSPGRAPEKAELIDAIELAKRLRGKPLIAFTGAGISAVQAYQPLVAKADFRSSSRLTTTGFRGRLPTG